MKYPPGYSVLSVYNELIILNKMGVLGCLKKEHNRTIFESFACIE